jgi:hypothetical protein
VTEPGKGLATVGLAALQATSNPAEVGHCAVCSRELIRTAVDCWHPAGALAGGPACPPEFTGPVVYGVMFGLGPGRPGRAYWRPGPAPRPEPVDADAVPKAERATLEVRFSDGTVSRLTYVPEDGGTLDLDVTVSVTPPDGLPGGFLTRSEDQVAVHEIVVKDAATWTHERLTPAMLRAERAGVQGA